MDGVDIRCQEHRNLSLDSRDLVRGPVFAACPALARGRHRAAESLL